MQPLYTTFKKLQIFTLLHLFIGHEADKEET